MLIIRKVKVSSLCGKWGLVVSIGRRSESMSVKKRADVPQDSWVKSRINEYIWKHTLPSFVGSDFSIKASFFLNDFFPRLVRPQTKTSCSTHPQAPNFYAFMCFLCFSLSLKSYKPIFFFFIFSWNHIFFSVAGQKLLMGSQWSVSCIWKGEMEEKG